MPLNRTHYNSYIGGSYPVQRKGVWSYGARDGVLDVFTSRSANLGEQTNNTNGFGTLGLTVGDSATLDLQYVSSFNVPTYGSPSGSGYTLTNSYRWSDWGGDIFDGWGYFHIFDQSSQIGVIPMNTSETLGASFEDYQRWLGPSGKYYQMRKAWLTNGICRMMVTCEDPEWQFRVVMGGNMGSDGLTSGYYGSLSNRSQPSGYSGSLPWIQNHYSTDISATEARIHYFRNYQSNSPTEYFTYFHMPMDQSLVTTNRRFILGSNGDNRWFRTEQQAIGHIFWFAKGNTSMWDRIWADFGSETTTNPNAYQPAA